jgi:hypothetical protein
MEVMLKHDVLIEGAQITRTWLKDVLSVKPPQLVMSQGTSDHEICVGIHLLMTSHVSDDLMFGLLDITEIFKYVPWAREGGCYDYTIPKDPKSHSPVHNQGYADNTVCVSSFKLASSILFTYKFTTHFPPPLHFYPMLLSSLL